MNSKIAARSTAFILLFSFVFIQGCVGKNRYMAELNKSETLVAQLENQNKETTRLEQEKQTMKNRFEAINRQAGLREKEQSGLINTQAEQIALLETRQESLVQQQKDLEQKQSNRINAQTEQIAQLEAQQETMAHQQKDLEQENQSLAEQLNSASNKTASLENMLFDAKKVAEQKMRDAQEIAKTREALIGSLKTEIDQGHIKISQMNDRLSVQIVSKILFSSGSDQVTGEGKNVLKKVSETLKTLVKNNIRVEGHTDNVPIGPELARKFPSNWELSTARATQVVRYLSQEEVDPKNLLAVGMAEYTPIASNDSPEGRQKNRRIEIVLIPK